MGLFIYMCIYMYKYRYIYIYIFWWFEIKEYNPIKQHQNTGVQLDIASTLFWTFERLKGWMSRPSKSSPGLPRRILSCTQIHWAVQSFEGSEAAKSLRVGVVLTYTLWNQDGWGVSLIHRSSTARLPSTARVFTSKSWPWPATVLYSKVSQWDHSLNQGAARLL